MSFIGLALDALLIVLLGAALVMGWRLNKRLKTLRESQAGFGVAVAELNQAATRAEQGLAALRAASDEAIDLLGDRIEKARQLAQRLEKLTQQVPAGAARLAPLEDDLGQAQERRLGALLAAAREARAKPERPVRREPLSRQKADFEDDLFEDPPARGLAGGRR
jgi:hypothetical protein